MCQIVCKITVTEKEAKEVKKKIEDEYRVNMLGRWFLTICHWLFPVTRPNKHTVTYQGVGVKGQYAAGGAGLLCRHPFSSAGITSSCFGPPEPTWMAGAAVHGGALALPLQPYNLVKERLKSKKSYGALVRIQTGIGKSSSSIGCAVEGCSAPWQLDEVVRRC